MESGRALESAARRHDARVKHARPGPDTCRRGPRCHAARPSGSFEVTILRRLARAQVALAISYKRARREYGCCLCSGQALHSVASFSVPGSRAAAKMLCSVHKMGDAGAHRHGGSGRVEGAAFTLRPPGCGGKMRLASLCVPLRSSNAIAGPAARESLAGPGLPLEASGMPSARSHGRDGPVAGSRRDPRRGRRRDACWQRLPRWQFLPWCDGKNCHVAAAPRSEEVEPVRQGADGGRRERHARR